MRYFIFFILLFSSFLNVHAQKENDLSSGNHDTINHSNEVRHIKTKISTSNFDFEKGRPITAVLDTNMSNFHLYNPLSKYVFSSTNLGYLGSPYISNDFFDRTCNSGYYFANVFNIYRYEQNKVEYYNTATPFAYLLYDQGNQPGSKYEQIFKAFFTQNIDSISNFGFTFSTIKNQGQYTFQAAKHRYLNFFISRNTKNYNGYASIITGLNEIQENGGIEDTIVNTRYEPNELKVQFDKSIGTSVNYFSFFTSHEYLTEGIPIFPVKKDSTNKEIASPTYGIQYSAQIDNNKRLFSEVSVDNTFFDTTFFDNNKDRIDSSSFFRFKHLLQFRTLEGEKSRFSFGKRVFIKNEIITATHPVPYGTINFNYSNLILGGEIYSYKNEVNQWGGLANYTLLGRNLGDVNVIAEYQRLIKIFKDSTYIYLSTGYDSKSADIFQEKWNDNHFKWNNDFKKQNLFNAKFHFYYPGLNLMTGINYSLTDNFIYNGKDIVPVQYDKPISVYNYWINNDLRIGHFSWANKFFIQGTTATDVLHLPLLNYYTSVSFYGTLFKVMHFQIGAEMYYNSKFYADKYDPSTSRFYLQDDVKTGGYPLLNLFANAKLKRTSAFAMLYHANSSFMGGNFFSSPGYPLNQMAFRFGFIWTFYD